MSDQPQTSGDLLPTNERGAVVPLSDEYPWQDAYRALLDAVKEEATAIRALVRDPDSQCPARALREQRLAALEWVLAVADELQRWEW